MTCPLYIKTQSFCCGYLPYLVTNFQEQFIYVIRIKIVNKIIKFIGANIYFTESSRISLHDTFNYFNEMNFCFYDVELSL